MTIHNVWGRRIFSTTSRCKGPSLYSQVCRLLCFQFRLCKIFVCSFFVAVCLFENTDSPFWTLFSLSSKTKCCTLLLPKPRPFQENAEDSLLGLKFPPRFFTYSASLNLCLKCCPNISLQHSLLRKKLSTLLSFCCTGRWNLYLLVPV